MLVTFHTPATGDVVMFEDTAVQLIRLMGHGDKMPGVLQPENLPEAIRLLKTGLEDGSSSGTDIGSISESDNNHDTEDDEPKISLRTRAFPLIQLLEAAKSEEKQVVWKS